ncbi:MAG: diguanylate cyclase [Campylobacterales bacterium]|nr:diguanylate cyclase [Campylobacterales bacterium]
MILCVLLALGLLWCLYTRRTLQPCTKEREEQCVQALQERQASQAHLSETERSHSAPDISSSPTESVVSVPEKARLLVVDDQPTNARMLANGLVGEYTVLIATGGAKALEIARSELPPDLILLDIMMPGIDGYTTCRELKNDPKTSRIPVIFVSALDEAHEEERGLNLGAVDYITKPFNLPIVKARVRNHISLKRQADLLEAMSHVDPLTRIANRRHFDEKLSAEAMRSARHETNLALMMIDIDYFKHFNDHYGHGLGDECLTRVAQALKSTLMRPADLLARYGGEEFVAVLPETDDTGAMQIASRMLEAISALQIPHAYSKAADHVTVSIDVVSSRVSSRTDAAQLLQRADEALYRAKATGRNRVEGYEL